MIKANYDINKNGKKEFFVLVDPATASVNPYTPAGDSSTPVIMWFEATGPDHYALLWSARIPGSNPGIFSWANFTIGDLDNDGVPEVWVSVPRGRAGEADPSPARLYAYEFNGTTFPTDPDMVSNLGLRDNFRYLTTSVSIDDVDGDGTPEIITTSRRDDFSGLLLGRTLMVFNLVGDVSPFGALDREFIDSSAVLKGGYVFSNYILDYDGNGKKEIWVPTWDMLALAAFEATGPDTYVNKVDLNQVTSPNDIGEHNGVRFYDVDGDTKPEMYWSGMSGDGSIPSAVYYMRSTSDISTLTAGDIFRVSPEVDPNGGNGFAGADIGDVDNNGKMDFICGSAAEIKNVYRLEYQSGALNDPASYSWTTIYQAGPADSIIDFENVAIGDDLDGDGKKEILLANLAMLPGGNDPGIVILKSKVGGAGVKEVSGAVPEHYGLSHNYPNPFNPSTSIEFSLKKSGPVTLKVYDVVGREVATLVNDTHAAGTYRVTFDASKLPSGTYIYSISSGGFTDVKKMLLVK
jgi:hypothetical protein